MAIQFARVERVSRSNGGNACRSGSYNARIKIQDEQTNISYSFSDGDNIYHEILLPDYVDKKFKDPRVLMNEVEKREQRKNSQLLKEWVLALPDDKNVSLAMKIEMIKEFIAENKFVEEGLGVQLDIHEPHDGEKNWHAHLLVTTRRFQKDGTKLGEKARDLEPQVRGGRSNMYVKSQEEENIGKQWKEVQNRIFERYGLENRVDSISTVPEKHIGPVRMRSLINKAVEENEIRRIGHLENIKEPKGVLARITRQQAIFTKNDIERAVKEVEGIEVKDRLIKECLVSSELVSLYEMVEGKQQETKYYTTKEVRLEEERLGRIANRVNAQENYVKSYNGERIAGEIQHLQESASLSWEQAKVLAGLLLSNQGIRILRGRAGAGKSYVLGEVNKIASKYGYTIVGLAPTHKAKSELIAQGYRSCDTVKGFLFKLHNGIVNLEKRSLIVVDEAGMVGTSDYLELMKVASRKDCNVILAGDERQLTSVGRGGMFEVFADRFGSYSLTQIKRQNQDWARELAMSFADSNVKEGLQILEGHGGLVNSETLEESMSSLIGEWSHSKFEINERLVITVRNQEVEALNRGIRELLKANHLLQGAEYKINNKIYAAGDRVVFKSTNKRVGVENGEFGILKQVGQDQFIVLNDKGFEISFNPREIEFTYGYASTVYKAQGASIKDVYVLHNGVSNSRSSYVVMSRHVEEVKLYWNKQATRGMKSLISQLGKVDEKAASIKYYSQDDLSKIKTKQENAKDSSVLNKVGEWFKDKAQEFSDRFHSNFEYYEYEVKAHSLATVEEVLDSQVKSAMIDEIIDQDSQEVKAYVNDNSKDSNNDQLIVSKANKEEQSYKEADVLVGSKVKIAVGQSNMPSSSNNSYNDKRLLWSELNKQEMLALKREIEFRADSIAYDLLGSPNRKLSNSHLLRWGQHGSIAMKVSGSKAGVWYDFEAAKGGNIIDLVKQEKNCNFGEAQDYLKDMVGFSRAHSLSVVKNLEADKFYQETKAQGSKEQYREIAKIRRANELYSKADAVKFQTMDHIAKRYLSQHRGISNIVSEYKLGHDLATCRMWDKASRQYYPTLIAFARDENQKITGGQATYLNQETGAKADIQVNKRSFGKISGSFVEIQPKADQDSSTITIIAEGVETALSLQESGIPGKILCSLGVSNIKNYHAKEGEKILIAADNDGIESPTESVVTKAKLDLEAKGAVVAIARPLAKGDFNDVLKHQGVNGVKQVIDLACGRLMQEAQIRCGNDITLGHFMEVGNNCQSATALENQVTVLTDNLDLAIKMVDARVNGKIICGYSQENLKNYKASEGERIILAIDQSEKLDKLSLEAIKYKLGDIAFVQTGYLDLEQQQKDRGGQNNHAYIVNTLNPVIELMQQYNKEEMNIIIANERFGKEQTDIDAFIQASNTIEQGIQAFKSDYKIESIKNKLLLLKDRTCNELLLHEQYKLFKPHVLQNMQEFNKLKGQCKSLPEYLSVSSQEKEFCINMYEQYTKAAEVFDQEHNHDLWRQYRMYTNNPNIFNDVSQYYNDALKLEACGTARLQFEVFEKNEPLNIVCNNILKIINHKLTYDIVTNCGDIAQHGYIVHNNIRYTSKLDYLEGLAKDSLINNYASRLIQEEITDIKQDQMKQQAIEGQKQEKLGREVEHKEALTQEIQRQDTKEQEREQSNIVKDRSRGFGLGD